MDKDLGVKVTRLRRRLSVESEETNSPPAPSTPTKKRGGRLAAKPQLELIDEDANESVPKRTPRKSIARDPAEPDEKVLTPARRSTRIRSNTSLLAEAAAVTPKVTDSPRAKRAARRNSQLGSDNETPVAAPVRQTRRSRKNSTTNVDIIDNDNQTPVAKQTKKTTKDSTPSANEKVEIPANDDNLVIYVVTVTDADTKKESNNKTESNENGGESSPTIRKSPRLKDKLEKKTPPNKDRRSKGDSSFQLSKEQTQSTEIVNNVISEKVKLEKTETPLSLDEESVTSTADSNEVNRNAKDNEASKNITLPVETISNDKMQIDSNSTQEDEIVMNKSKLYNKDERYEKSDVEKLLENDPRNMQSIILIDDSDSNSGKLVMDLPHEGEDQCVPVVHSNHLENDTPKTLDEPEPMDIDESIPSNVTLNDFEKFVETNTKPINQTPELSKKNSFELISTVKANVSNQSLNKSKRTSSISVPSEDINEKNDSKSKRTSSISIALESSFQNVDMGALNKSKRTSHSEINSNLQASNKSSDYLSCLESNKENLTLNEKLQTSSKSSNLCTDDENNPSANSNKCNEKSSMSLSENSKVNSPKTYGNKNKSRNSSRHSETAENSDTNSVNENQANKPLLKEDAQDHKSLINIEDNSLNKSRNKNKSSTTVAQADTQNLEKSTNENKSTLVLSQLKDISANDTKNASKSHDASNELSKSLTVTDIAKNPKNNIANVLTSTPLQQKSVQKLGMQINTSMISPNAGNKSVDIKTNKKASPTVESSDSDSSDEENDVKNKSKMIDDEASEASEDYESGDSRDDDERQYEVDNEIIEKGETLESEQDFSNDSDYEKDSFVVSSDAEDDDLLSGTGNDLSLSDTELTMSKKSKKKYDERKRKEQKKASREMYEARHSLNKSSNDSKSGKAKSNKKKAKPLESSESENETERPKKKKRMRIDSSHDATVLKSDVDESIGYKKKKTKRLSESVCEDTTTVNEKEITICNESVPSTNDPLSTAIKLEPKTPQKDFNISTVPIVDKIEEVEVGDKTVINSNETSDPLQATMAQDEDSLSSENMEIVQNYDSLLNNLNDQRKVKSLDMSLNIEQKSGAKSKEPIIDQLNLTQTKKDKKNKSVNKSLNEKEKSNTNVNKNVSKVVQDEESSDSIAMELLFPEDSNDSEVNVTKSNQDKKTVEPAEEYIPLKKTEGKTHIPETLSTSTNLSNSELNKSNSKKESNTSQADAGDSSEPTESLNFFVDVTGDLNLSNSKKKNKKTYFNEEQDIDSKQSNRIGENNVQNVTVGDEAPTDVLIKSDKKKKKKHKHLNVSANESIVTETKLNNEAERREAEVSNKDQSENKDPDQSLNISVKYNKENKNLDVSKTEQPKVEGETQISKKKARKSSEKLTDEILNVNMSTEENINNDGTTPKSDKKKKKKHENNDLVLGEQNVPSNEQETTSLDIVPETSFNTNKKKHKKKHNISNTENTQVTEPNHDNLDKREEEKLFTEIVPETSFNTDKKKHKKKHNTSNTENTQVTEQNHENLDERKAEKLLTEIAPESSNIDKKKHKKKHNTSNTENTQVTEQNCENLDERKAEKLLTEIAPETSDIIKKKHKKKHNTSNTESAQVTEQTPENLETSLKTEKKKKKKHQNSDVSINDQSLRLGQLFESQTVEQSKDVTPENTIEDPSLKSEKKKKKKHENKDLVQGEQNIPSNEQETTSLDPEVVNLSKKKHKKKHKVKDTTQAEQSDDAPEELSFKFEKATVEVTEITEQKAKKRKLEAEEAQVLVQAEKSKKKRKLTNAVEISTDQGDKTVLKQKASKKRKRQETEMEVDGKKAKVSKEHSLDKVHIPRLPLSVLEQLDDKPQVSKKGKAIATSEFIVEEAPTRKNKPSTYLEQSVYLNDTPKKDKKKHKLKKNPVLPFIPTAETSEKGFTSNFRINVLSETPFVASNTGNFKADYLANQRIKKLGSFERFKTQRSHKLCKF